MKVVKKIVKISKKEMEYLVSKGLKFGTNSEGDLHKTISNVKTYYLTESKYAMRLLNEYRKSRIVAE